MPSVRPELARFFTSLHATVFKPRGYTKTRHTFRREEGMYALAFQLQGSDWNSAEAAWRFYLNVGIRFPDLPRREPDRDFPTIHSWTRVGASLSQWSEPYYEVSDENQDILIGKIAAIVHDCERYFLGMHETLRRRYMIKEVPFLGYLDEALMKK